MCNFRTKTSVRSVESQLTISKKPVKREEPFEYDVFVSYSQHNEAWIHSQLLPVLDSSQPKLSVCFHERDFDAGKSIVENIVDSIDRSRKCLIILSDKYIGSSWCMFEALLASHRLIQVGYKRELIPVIYYKGLNKYYNHLNTVGEQTVSHRGQAQ